MCHLLEWEARRCFETRCSSNSYTPHRYTYTTNISAILTGPCRWLSKQDFDRDRVVATSSNNDTGPQPSLAEQLYGCSVGVRGNITRYLTCRRQFLHNLELRVAAEAEKNQELFIPEWA